MQNYLLTFSRNCGIIVIESEGKSVKYLIFDCREDCEELIAECKNLDLAEEIIEDYVSYEKCEKKDIKIQKTY